MRLRILAGAAALVLGLAAYAIAVAEVAIRALPGDWAVRVVFFVVAGVAWVWPAALLTRWMQSAPPYRPPPAG
jgi:hypothetical protein